MHLGDKNSSATFLQTVLRFKVVKVEFQSAPYTELKSLWLYQAFDISRVRGSVPMSWFILHPEYTILALQGPLLWLKKYLEQQLCSSLVKFRGEYRWFYQSSFYKQHVKYVAELWRFLISKCYQQCWELPQTLHWQRMWGKGALETSWPLTSVHWGREYFWLPSTWRSHIAKEERWNLEMTWQAAHKAAFVPVPTLLPCAASASRSRGLWTRISCQP